MSNKKLKPAKQRRRDKDHTAFYKWLKHYGVELENIKKRLTVIEKKLNSHE